MALQQYTNLNFEDIKISIKDYLRENSNFTDMDFEGSNLSVLINLLAYNSYQTAYNTNMVVNETFIDSATLRENVVSLARNIGYVPRSRRAAKAKVDYFITGLPTSTETISFEEGIVSNGTVSGSNYIFSLPETVTGTVSDGDAEGTLEIYQGQYLSVGFTVGAVEQRFILPNDGIDTSTIIVKVRENASSSTSTEYRLVDNILGITSTSNVYLIQETTDEKYELLFGDNVFGKKLESGNVINVSYIKTEGSAGNGVQGFKFSGTIRNSDGGLLDGYTSILTPQTPSENGDNIEPVASVRYYAPRIYSSQYRAVTPRDYEAIIKKVYPETESVAVVGGEELDPPEFGNVLISIKPKNGTFVSDFNKSRILSQLKQYTVSGINQKIEDLKLLYVEVVSSVYYDNNKVSNIQSLRTQVINSLETYADSLDMNKFGGRFKYSKVQQVIDQTDTAITSNITRVIIRRDLKVVFNQFAQYELCYGNRFHVRAKGLNIKSSGFYVSNNTAPVYITDIPNEDLKTGVLALIEITEEGEYKVIAPSAGTVDYLKGEVMIDTVNITRTVNGSEVIEIQAIPESNDVVGLKELYLDFSLSKSKINMVRDVISSGDEITGTTFVNDFYTSSYLNGQLIRE